LGPAVSDGAFHAYVGLLALGALVPAVLAVRGFGQSVAARIVDGVLAAVFLGYAGYLMIADPESVLVVYYAFLAPVYAVVHAVRNRRTGPAVPAGRSGAGSTPSGVRGETVAPGPGIAVDPPADDADRHDYHPTPGYQTDQSGYARQSGWTKQNRYPADTGPAPAAYLPDDAAYPPRTGHPEADPGYPPSTEDLGHSQRAADPGYSPWTGAHGSPAAGYPMESDEYFAEAGHRAEDPWYPPAPGEARPADPHTTTAGHRRADDAAGPGRTGDRPGRHR
jgi:hypothetical protein